MSIKMNEVVLNEQRNVTLTSMLHGATEGPAQRPAVLILPGGGYQSLADGESETVAYSFLNAGFQAFVLRYSIAEHKTWPNPLDDYEQAMEMIRSHAEEWNVASDKIAVMGFSAGGHLTACAATISKNRPNAAILGYAATSKELSSSMSTEKPLPVPNEHVDVKTCPCFLMATCDDTAVPIGENSVSFTRALAQHGIQFESHIYAYGGHGFSNGQKSVVGNAVCSRVSNWQRDCIEWLWDVFGDLMPQGFESPRVKSKINGDYEEVLSIDCTMGYLKNQNEEAAAIVESVWSKLKMVFPNINAPDTLESFLFNRAQLRSAFDVLHTDQAEVKRIDLELHKIKNQFLQ